MSANPSRVPSGQPRMHPPAKAMYRVPEAMRLLSLSRSVIYEQIRSGRLRSVKQGRARLIPDDAIADYIELLKREAGQVA